MEDVAQQMVLYALFFDLLLYLIYIRGIIVASIYVSQMNM